MALETLALPAVMVVALLLVFWGVSSRGWRSYEFGEPAGSTLGRLLNWLWSSPTAWLLVFVATAVGISFAAILAVSGDRVMSFGGGTVLTAVLGGIGVLLAGFLFFGTYFSIKSRGTQNSIAAALSALMMGFVILGVITLRLAGVV